MAGGRPVPDDFPLGGTRVSNDFLINARPPTDRVRLGQWTLERFAELRVLRGSLHQVLVEQPLPEGGMLGAVPEKMAIVATELAANAMAHTRPPTTVRLSRTEWAFILEVVDNSPWVVPRFAERGPVTSAGLGLRLARQLSLDMGWHLLGPAKCVWAQIAIPTVPHGTVDAD
jgi:serine/threonine-protein kinase RsbW